MADALAPALADTASPLAQAVKLDDIMLAMDVVDTLRHQDSFVARELDEDAREQELIARDRAGVIRRAIEKLPDKQRAAVLLHKYQELDYDEIAGILECSEAALKSLLFRAYETLRVELAPLVGQPRA